MKTPIRTALFLLFSILILAGCGLFLGSSALKSKTYGIKFTPVGNSGTLRVDTANKGCKANPHNGCMYFPENTVGLVKFYLPGGQNNSKTCADNVRSVITQVQLTTTGNASKGDYTVFPLDAWIKSEAFSAVDLNTGIVYEKDVNAAANQVWLLNQNANDPAAGEKTFWYKVTATDCNTPANTWVTDPRGRNGGTY